MFLCRATLFFLSLCICCRLVLSAIAYVFAYSSLHSHNAFACVGLLTPHESAMSESESEIRVLSFNCWCIILETLIRDAELTAPSRAGVSSSSRKTDHNAFEL